MHHFAGEGFLTLRVSIRHLVTNNYEAQCLETLICNLVHLVPELVGIRHLYTKSYREQYLETLIGNLVHLLPFLVCIRHPDTYNFHS